MDRVVAIVVVLELTIAEVVELLVRSIDDSVLVQVAMLRMTGAVVFHIVANVRFGVMPVGYSGLDLLMS